MKRNILIALALFLMLPATAFARASAKIYKRLKVRPCDVTSKSLLLYAPCSMLKEMPGIAVTSLVTWPGIRTQPTSLFFQATV